VAVPAPNQNVVQFKRRRNYLDSSYFHIKLPQAGKILVAKINF